VEQAHDTFKHSIEQLHELFTNPIYVLVVDIADFPTGIAPELVAACKGRAIVLVNKLDLLLRRLQVCGLQPFGAARDANASARFLARARHSNPRCARQHSSTGWRWRMCC